MQLVLLEQASAQASALATDPIFVKSPPLKSVFLQIPKTAPLEVVYVESTALPFAHGPKPVALVVADD